MMQAANWVLFKTYSDPVLAQEVKETLESQGVVCQLTSPARPLDNNFLGATYQGEIELKIPAEDLEQANAILTQEASQWLADLPSSYYLFSFTNQELWEILQQPDQWNELDYSLAQHLLRERGEPLGEQKIAALKSKRWQELAQPDEEPSTWLYLGYALALLGGILGIFIGWYLWQGKKTLPNGQRVYAYTPNSRQHGRRMVYLSGTVLLIGVFATQLIR
ncbi:MAG: hypothetical protein AAF399_17810 [Bacteroidota bacterium]